VRIHAADLRAVRGFSLGLHLLIKLRQLFPSGVQWNMDSRGSDLVIDRLVGTQRLRIALDQGQSVADILAWCEQDSAQLREESRSIWLYS
jgi:uncharacterized protein YbbC (DUF1343 family)